MRVIAVLVVCVMAVTALPSGSPRIVGGSLTTIDRYPSIVACLVSANHNYYLQLCGGSILSSRSILTAAHCIQNRPVFMFRFRAGSTFANSGGVVYNVQQIIEHPKYNITAFLDYDFAIMRSASNIVFNYNVSPVSFARPNQNLADNEVVWAAGWGTTKEDGSLSEKLRHVQVYTINQEICRSRYASRLYIITDNMLCSGILDMGGRDQCQQDSGGPLYHNGVLVGVCSFGVGCAQGDFPGVNARVSRASAWIERNI